MRVIRCIESRVPAVIIKRDMSSMKKLRVEVKVAKEEEHQCEEKNHPSILKRMWIPSVRRRSQKTMRSH